jgi:hypothetical protein
LRRIKTTKLQGRGSVFNESGIEVRQESGDVLSILRGASVNLAPDAVDLREDLLVVF